MYCWYSRHLRIFVSSLYATPGIYYCTCPAYFMKYRTKSAAVDAARSAQTRTHELLLGIKQVGRKHDESGEIVFSSITHSSIGKKRTARKSWHIVWHPNGPIRHGIQVGTRGPLGYITVSTHWERFTRHKRSQNILAKKMSNQLRVSHARNSPGAAWGRLGPFKVDSETMTAI